MNGSGGEATGVGVGVPFPTVGVAFAVEVAVAVALGVPVPVAVGVPVGPTVGVADTTGPAGPLAGLLVLGSLASASSISLTLGVLLNFVIVTTVIVLPLRVRSLNWTDNCCP